MIENKHTPLPWGLRKEHDESRKITVWRIDSPTRALMAMLEVWDLNRNAEWRAANPDRVAEHAETMTEVAHNAALMVTSGTMHEALRDILRECGSDEDVMSLEELMALRWSVKIIAAAVLKQCEDNVIL